MELVRDQIRVKLELFEGPLDLLLHLIRTQHIDIAAIPIAHITEQYLKAIEMMQKLDLDIAGEYLVMAATLMLIKSRMLLPPAPGSQEDESAEDLREELIRRLQEYETYKQAGTHLEHAGQERSHLFSRSPDLREDIPDTEWVIEASVIDLLKALDGLMERNKELPEHLVRPNPVSVRQRMSQILMRLQETKSILFEELYMECRYRHEVIGLFLAVLELMKMHSVKVRQKQNFGEIRLFAVDSRKDSAHARE